MLLGILTPDILKYGFAGLLLALAILLYRLLRGSMDEQSHKRTGIVVFGVFVLIAIGAYLFNTYAQGVVLGPCLAKTDSLNISNLKLTEELRGFRLAKEEHARLKLESDRMSAQVDSMRKLVRALEDSKNAIPSARNLAQKLEDGLVELDDITGARQKQRELLYLRLKRTVFLNVLHFRADKSILAEGLRILANQREDVLEEDIPRILGMHKEILRIKRKWLKDTAIPTLQRAIITGEDASNENRTRVYIAPMVRTSLDRFDYVTVNDLRAMEDEIDLISNMLANLRS